MTFLRTGKLIVIHTAALLSAAVSARAGDEWQPRAQSRQPRAPRVAKPAKSLEQLVRQAEQHGTAASAHGGSSGAAGPAPTSSKAMRTPIATLSVKIQVSNEPFASLSGLPDVKDVPGLVGLPEAGGIVGESDDLYVDLGPYAWNLKHTFPPGQESSFNLPLPAALCEEDITQLRLEKKGVLGFTNAPDTFFYGLGSFPSVADSIKLLRISVQQTQYSLGLINGALSEKETVLRSASEAFDQAEKLASDANALVVEATKRIDELNSLQNELAAVDAKVASLPAKIPVPKFKKIWKVPIPDGFEMVDNPLLKPLIDKKNELLNKINTLKSDGIDWVARKGQLAADLQVKLTIRAAKLQTKVAAETAYQATKLQLNAAEATLSQLQQRLGQLEALAQKVPSVLPRGPVPGQLAVNRVTLLVNGRERSFEVGQRLRQNHYSWIHRVGDLSPVEQFVRGLRIEPAREGKPEQQSVWQEILHNPMKFFDHPDLITTGFKEADISGWEDYPKDRPHVPIGSALVIGKLIRTPNEGTDANVSLDLRVMGVECDGKRFTLIGDAGTEQFPLPRYIRCEYRFGTDRRFSDQGWQEGDVIKAAGPVRWDTDRNGFFEIHPKGKESISRLWKKDSTP